MRIHFQRGGFDETARYICIFLFSLPRGEPGVSEHDSRGDQVWQKSTRGGVVDCLVYSLNLRLKRGKHALYTFSYWLVRVLTHFSFKAAA